MTPTSASPSQDKDSSTKVDYARAGRAGGYYHMCCTEREPYLFRARRSAELTMPTLFMPQGAAGGTDQVIPWNSIGAYCLGNLASKVVTALFPAGQPNFKASADKRSLMDLAQLPVEERATIKAVIDQGLSKLEKDTAEAIEEDGDRAKMFVAALLLLVGGNHTFQFYPDSTIRGIRLDNFVTTRDPQGNLLKFCIEDASDWELLPEDVRQGLKDEGIPEPEADAFGRRALCIYTMGYMEDGKWHVYQEVLSKMVPGSDATYAKDALPYLFLPWIILPNEHYGRSYCEFYEGDLLTAEALTKALGEGAAAVARFLTFINPVGLTSAKTVANAKNGDVISGREQDIYTFRADKGGDLQVAKSTLDDGLARLSRAFLLNTSVQRSGERVTAEEIRYVAGELEDALGGVYSQQVISWQAPYIKLKLKFLMLAKRVARVPQQAVKITVTAGLAALARNAELQSLQAGISIVAQALGAEGVTKAVKPNAFVMRVFTALGIDTEGLTYTDDEIAAQAQQDQMAQMATAMGPEAIRQLGGNITSNQVAATNAEAKMATAAPAEPQQ